MVTPQNVETEYRIENHRDCKELGGRLTESLGEMLGEDGENYVMVEINATSMKKFDDRSFAERVFDDVVEKDEKNNSDAENND